MSMPPSVIVIDEPNSFLHPGAVKKLLQVPKIYKHQYIISTHSPEIISSIDIDKLNLVKWEESQSRVVPLKRSDVEDLRLVLGEVGVGLSDIFAADRVIWVEGPTEQECFPKLYRHKKGRLPLGLSFLGVLNTGDFEAKDWTARRIWDLYRRLGQANGILPVATAFCLDRELRTEKEMDEMNRTSGGVMRFLPRRSYENYLLHAPAIQAVINADLADEDALDVGTVSAWISDHGNQFHPSGLQPTGEGSGKWIAECDASLLLAKMTQALTDGKLEYRKTRHSVAITEWLLQNAPEVLDELSNYVTDLVPDGGDRPNVDNAAA
jgi:hypothetical protein